MATSATTYGAGKQPADGAHTMLNGFYSATLTGNLTLDMSYQNHLRLDPGGSARDVTLPAEAGRNGAWFRILNTADAAENLVVKDDGGSTIVTVSHNEAVIVVCDGTSWVHMGIESISLS